MKLIFGLSALLSLLALLALLALSCPPASAITFSEIPRDSIDTMFERCFADAECAKQIEPLISKFSKDWDDLPTLVHHCMGDVRTMSICAAFSDGIVNDEMERMKVDLAESFDSKCVARWLAGARRSANAKAAACSRFAKSLGDSADGRMSATSCRADAWRNMLAYLRQAQARAPKPSSGAAHASCPALPR